VPGQWLETLFYIPGTAIIDKNTHIRLEVDNDSQAKHFSIYYLWAVQGTASYIPVAVKQPVGAVFSKIIMLQGFDTPQNVWKPGDVFPISLYWSAIENTTSVAKVFVHLYTADGTLDQQSDGWAYNGTRPPYTWQPDEIIFDPRYIALPASMVPGAYTVEVGLYDTEGRLPAYVDGVRQSEGRVILTQIEVRADNQ
jgi:hypothetical protein